MKYVLLDTLLLIVSRTLVAPTATAQQLESTAPGIHKSEPAAHRIDGAVIYDHDLPPGMVPLFKW